VTSQLLGNTTRARHSIVEVLGFSGEPVVMVVPYAE
jgi:hypothetical protein